MSGSIQDLIQETILPSRPNNSSASLLPSFTLSHTSPSSRYHSITDEPASESLANTSSTSQKLSWLDATTLASTNVIHASAQSTNKFNYCADDRFVEAKNLRFFVPALHNLRQIQPQSLSLFDLAVLADTVHNHDPLYSILKSQCFWFANIICDIVEREYHCNTICSESFARVSRDDICIPPNNYLPDLAGRWMGILVSKVEEAVLLVVASDFREYKEVKHTEVTFYQIPIDLTNTRI